MKRTSRRSARPASDAAADQAFWSTQIVGWVVLALLGFCVRLIVFQSLPLAIEGTAVVDSLGFVLTSIMARQPFMRFRSGRLPHSIALAVLWCIGIALLLSFIAFHLRIAVAPTDHQAIRGSRFAVGLIYYVSIITAWTLAHLGRCSEIEARAQRIQAMAAESRALRIELESLQGQIAPHFLFNVLNTLVAEIGDHPDVAEEMTRQLAAYLRYSLAKTSQQVGPVAAELDAVDMYVRIQALRFDERFSYIRSVDPDALSANIPHMAIQCLVENAIKHGLQGEGARFDINVRVNRIDDSLVVEVDNPSRAKSLLPRETAGIGLANMRRRLELRYPERHAFSLRQDAGRTIATLTLRGDPCSV